VNLEIGGARPSARGGEEEEERGAPRAAEEGQKVTVATTVSL
jgi:hypothetical protein